VQANHALQATVWIAALLACSVDVIIWTEITGSVPAWLPWLHAIALLTTLAVTLLVPKLRPAKGFVLILVLIFFLGFGGGWQWGLIPLIRQTTTWSVWEAQLPWAVSSIAVHLLRLIPAAAILSYLLFSGKKRKDIFLTKGQMTAPIEPTKLLGIRSLSPGQKQE
jgi:hypothetical protein